MTDREAMKLAFEALKTADKKIIAGGIESDARLQMKNAITALRQALEQPEQPQFFYGQDHNVLPAPDKGAGRD